jgi:hypothetical protein
MRKLLALVVGVSMALIATPAVAQTVTIAAAGDISKPAKPGSGQKQTAALINQFNPTAVFALGDTQYKTGLLSDYNASYDPTWGAFLSKTYPIIGNHEYENPSCNDACGYRQYFGSRAFGGSDLYYSFNIGNWHVAALNTECSQIDCAAEKTWLKNDLKTDTHACDMVIWHRTNSSWPLNIGSSNHVDLGLAASRHVYERYAPKGSMLKFTVGTGGYSLGKLSGTQVAGENTKFGVLELTLNDSGYSYRFVEGDGTVFDSGSGGCTA